VLGFHFQISLENEHLIDVKKAKTAYTKIFVLHLQNILLFLLLNMCLIF